MATRDQLSAQITALHQEVRELRRIVEQGYRAIDAEQPKHVADNERGVFIPGTGWTETNAPVSDGVPVPFNEAAERARELREQLRKGSE